MTTLPSSLAQPKSAPGPVGLINGLRNIRAFQADILGFLTRLAREYGDFTQFSFGPFRMYFANHPDLIHQVLVEDAAKYYKTKLTKELLRPSLGNGLLMTASCGSASASSFSRPFTRRASQPMPKR